MALARQTYMIYHGHWTYFNNMFIVQILQQKVELNMHACDNFCKQSDE